MLLALLFLFGPGVVVLFGGDALVFLVLFATGLDDVGVFGLGLLLLDLDVLLRRFLVVVFVA
jgi:hypothetical protein